MRALMIQLQADGKREKVLVDDWADLPPIKEDQVRTETLLSGLTNGTERNGLIGGNYAPSDRSLPTGSGYQNVGCVIEVGSEVDDLEVSDVVYSSQGHYGYCTLRPHKLENLMPHERHDGLLIKLDPRVDPTHAALFGVASVAMRCCRNADLRMGERFLVIGAGMVGQMAAQIGNAMGAHVTICDIDQKRLDIAESAGAVEVTVNVSEDGWEQQIEDASYDTILDVAGVVGMEDKLIRATKHGGSILFIAGRFKVEYTFNLGQHREINIKQNSHFDKDDLDNLQRLVARGVVNMAPLILDIVPVLEAKPIYDRLRDQPQELLGTVFDWR
ncbi:MAG: zinc-binding alcohol dehydrogenase [Candidatus Poribacteria bacterium]